ncbi:thioredoxin fold domain-containing protein [Sinimarinibacterium sp. NLF-5-8]|uniref:thioredoxin fold domain-containing protein n=1 Tax=Sinimarinibacterium sp. NLF-5-8 TaxID=2698684 RepID=UPI00137C1F55|nr:thioredoxin fold domain-containing protein [Sinimarinibacterium sp. NLF-5-8]QHS09120.1 thioredoxin fold domain-containing protein [Sinimarinibacterium sp. NLF-5-8]
MSDSDQNTAPKTHVATWLPWAMLAAVSFLLVVSLYGGPTVKTATAPAPVSTAAPVAPVADVADVPAPNPALTMDDIKSAMATFAGKYNLEVLEVLPQDKGLWPVIISSNKQANVVYVNASGLISTGNLFDLASGEAFMPPGLELAMKRHQDDLSRIDFAALSDDIKKAATVTADKGGPELYMFYEPHCGYCMMTQAELEKHEVTIHYIPVTFLSEESQAIAGVMLNTPQDEVPQMMHEVSQRGAQAGFAERGAQYAADADLHAALEHNNKLMGQMGFSGTPAFFFARPDGTWGTHNGALVGPPLETLLSELRGAAAQ